MIQSPPPDMPVLEAFKTVTESGSPVKARISSIDAARKVYDNLCMSDEEDAKRRARLRGHVNGNPPYDPVRLEELGLGYMTNTNFLEMRSALEAKAGMAYELFFEVPTLVDIKVSALANAQYVDEQQPSVDYGRIMSEEFTRLLLDWPGFLANMDTARREADLVGVGPVLFRDEWDWRFKAFNYGSFKVPATASLDIDSWPVCAFKDSMSASDLYEAAISDPEVAKAAGWNQRVVRDVLRMVYVQALGAGQQAQEKWRTTQWEEVEARYRNKDWQAELSAFEDVQIVHVLCAEVKGASVTHMIFSESMPPEGDDFMFSKPNRYENMSQAVWFLPYSNANGTVRSVRGLASLLEPHCDLSNRFLGRVFDAGFMSASLLLQPKTAMDMSKLQVVRAGSLTVIPPELQAIQSSFTPPISPLVQLRDLSSAIMRNNTGLYRQNPENFAENQPQKTARQVVEEVSKEARGEKAATAFDYSYIERLYREVFRRATRKEFLEAKVALPGQLEAKSFVMRCISRGVPYELISQVGAFELYATRAIGMGSWGVKLDITNQLIGARNLLDEQGQANAVREWLAVRVGYQNVDRFKSLKNRDTIPSNEMSIATLENNSFANGQPVPVGSDQFHSIHSAVHGQMVESFGEVVQQATKGGQTGNLDITRMARTLQVLLPHLQDHIKFMAQDQLRQEQVQAGVARLKMGQQLLKMLVTAIEQRSKQTDQARQEQADSLREEGAQQMSEEMQLKMAEMEREFALKADKLASLNKMREVKTQETLALNRARAAEDVRLKAERQAADISLDQLKAQADVEVKMAKAQQPSRPA